MAYFKTILIKYSVIRKLSSMKDTNFSTGSHGRRKPIWSLIRILSRWINKLRPGDVYMRRWNGPSLIQVIVCSLCDPVSTRTNAESCLTNHKQQIAGKVSSEYEYFLLRTIAWQISDISFEPYRVKNDDDMDICCLFSKKSLFRRANGWETIIHMQLNTQKRVISLNGIVSTEAKQ